MIAALMLAAALGQPADALDAFAGHWRVDGLVAAAGGKPDRRLVFDQQCSWTPRRAYLVCEQSTAAEAARSAELTLLRWDAETRAYRFSGFGMSGLAAEGTITIDGPTWIWTSVAGTTRFRTINRFVHPNRVEFRSERSTDGGASWTVQAHGTESRS